MILDDDTKWQAVVDCDPAFDGVIYYVVATVGVCCRPSCRSRTPKRGNVVYFDSVDDAVQAGYRPCRRCRPDEIAYDPMDQIVSQAKGLIDSHYGQRRELAIRMNDLGVSSGHLATVFRERVGCTPVEYMNRVRTQHACELLDQATPIADVAFALGFDALGAFYRMFKQQTGRTPLEYQKRNAHLTHALLESPIGQLTVVADGSHIIRVLLPTDQSVDIGTPVDNGILEEAVGQLGEYFAGTRRTFSLPVDACGTDFQRAVWGALKHIPYSHTATYADIAVSAGHPQAARAVGQANNRNPVPIIIPCHRVVGSSGALVGYRGGIEAKQWLLNHERANA